MATKQTKEPVKSDGLHIDGVTKQYRNATTGASLEALSEIRFEVPNRSFVSIVGPSGCGKSTLLRIIAGLDKATTGRVVFRDAVIDKPSVRRGVVFQEPSLLPWRTVLANVGLGLELNGVRRADREARAKDLIELVGLAQFVDAYPRELSGGMQQRAAIARALTMGPELLLLDEPFGALDEQTRLILGEELLRIWSAIDTTVVLITHSIQEAILLSDQVIVMSARPGRILDIHHVLLPRPRDSECMSSTTFREIQSLIWKRLKPESNLALGRDIA